VKQQTFKRKQKIRRRRFDPSIYKAIYALKPLDNWHGPMQVAEDWVVIAVAAWVAQVAFAHAHPAVAVLVYAHSVFVIGGRQRALADLLHQSSHRVLAASKTLNRVLGTYFSGYLVLQSYSGYYWSHVVGHHVNNGTQDDQDWQGLEAAGLCAENRSVRAVVRYLVGLFGPIHAISYVRYLVENRIFPAEERTQERPRRVAFLGALIATVVGLGSVDLLVLYWLIPFFTSNLWIGGFLELLEHYPANDVGETRHLHLSRNRHWGRFVNFYLGVHWEGYHQVHHEFPFLPSWRYAAAHEVLMADTEYAALNSVRGFVPTLVAFFEDVRASERRTSGRLPSVPGHHAIE